MQDGSLIRRSGAYSAGLSGPLRSLGIARWELYRSAIRTCRATCWVQCCYALTTCQVGKELALRKRYSFAAAMLKGLFRRRADALERQGGIIIVVVVRFDRDTAACLWKGALTRPIIQGSSYVVSLCSNDMSVHTYARIHSLNALCTFLYFTLYRAFGAFIGSLEHQSMYYKPC